MSSFNKSQIVLRVDDVSKDIESAIMDRQIVDNYTMVVEQLTIKKDRIDDLIEKMKTDALIGNNDEHKYEDVRFEFSEVNRMRMIKMHSEDLKWFLRCSSGTEETFICYFYSNSMKAAERFYTVFKEFEFKTSNIGILINNISTNHSGGLSTTDNIRLKEIKDLEEVSSLYYPFLDTNEMFHQYLVSKDKLLLLSGEPGTGKTKIIDLFFKYCILNPGLLEFDEDDIEDGFNIRAAYVKNTDVLALDQFWNHLNQQNYDIVILDDIDYMLTDRKVAATSYDDTARKKFISHFLSFTDGIYDKPTKFIITSNQDIGLIDKAILRKGRCFDILSFRKLTTDECLKIWKEAGLNKKEFDKEFKDSEDVLACDVGSKVNLYRNSISKGVKHKPYVLEDNISIISKVSNKKIIIGGDKK